MVKVYACLAGEWVCVSDDPECTISEWGKSPYLWWKEGAPVYAPIHRDSKIENSFYGLNYMHIHYKGNDWRINPMFVQIVNG